MSELAPAAPVADAGGPDTGADMSDRFNEDGSLKEEIQHQHAAPQKAKPAEKPLIDQAKTGQPQDKDTEPVEAKPAKVQIPKTKLKAKNRELEVDDYETLRHYASRGFGLENTINDQKTELEELRQLKQKVEGLKNPKTRAQLARELMGDDVEQFAEETAYEKFTREQQLAQLSDRERAFFEQMQAKDKKLEEFHRKEQEQNQLRAQHRERAMLQGIGEQIEATAIEAINAMGVDIKYRPEMSMRVVKQIESLISQGIPLDPKAISTFVLGEVEHEQSMLYKNMPPERMAAHFQPHIQRLGSNMTGEQLHNWMGEKIANELMRYSLAKRRGGVARSNQPPQQGHAPMRDPSAPIPSRPKWDEIDELIRGGR